MKLSLKIALRYLFAKKSHSAINVISAISVCGVAITTMALVCALSVFNGFHDLIASLYSSLDPQIKVTPAHGKTLDTQNKDIKAIALWDEVAIFEPTIEENALAVYRNKQMPVVIKGVDQNYRHITTIDSVLLDGEFTLKDPIANYATVGVGVANQISVGVHYMEPLQIFSPKRNANVNLANPTSSFNTANFFVNGVFSVNQPQYDDQWVIIPMDMARQLLNYTTEATAIEIKLKKEANESAVIDRIRQTLGKEYIIQNRIEQQETAFRIMQIEKWITFLILSFILMIATFNVISSLSMLIIDKQHDIKTLQNLGADNHLISKIFTIEGWLISIVGAGSGLLLGIILCLLQQEFGWLRLGDNPETFIVNAYPVKLEWFDTIAVLIIVLLLGAVAAKYPVRYLRHKWLTNTEAK